MPRPQTHLREVVSQHGTPDGTSLILPIIASGLQKLADAEKAHRIVERGTDKKLNPSVSDAGKCERKVVLSLMNIPETNPPDVDSQLRFALGHAFEDAIARVLEAHQGATYLREERVEIAAGDTKITGRRDFDAVRVELLDSILELKSTNARAMGFLLKRGTPNEDHVRQLNLYLSATGKAKGYLVYLVAGSTKGEPILHAWTVNYDQNMAHQDITALAAADLRAKTQNVPAIPHGYARGKYPCGTYCPYNEFCWGDVAIPLAASIEARQS